MMLCAYYLVFQCLAVSVVSGFLLNGEEYCYEQKCKCKEDKADCTLNLRLHFIPKLPSNIKTMDFSYNRLKRIDSKYLFVNVTQITSLTISHNLLTYIAPDAFDLLENLTSLDISFNDLTGLPEFSPDTRNRLQHMDASENYFRCRCDLVWFSRWVVSSPSVFNDSYDESYQCLDEITGHRRNIAELSNHGEQACINRDASTVLIVIFSTILIVIVIVVTIALIVQLCRHFPAKQPWIPFRLLNTKQQRLACITRVAMRYDIFVAYADEDRSLVLDHLVPAIEGRLGLKMCLHERDFQPGKNILQNIEDAMGSSTKVMMIFSSHFARSQWCQFELSLGKRHTMDRHDEPVVIYTKSAAPDLELTSSMVAIMRTSTYIPWPEQGEDQALFWRSLRLALKDVLQLQQQRPRQPPRQQQVAETEIV